MFGTLREGEAVRAEEGNEVTPSSRAMGPGDAAHGRHENVSEAEECGLRLGEGITATASRSACSPPHKFRKDMDGERRPISCEESYDTRPTGSRAATSVKFDVTWSGRWPTPSGAKWRKRGYTGAGVPIAAAGFSGPGR
ncbi:hypothetical protein OF83DRAFT_1082506 [Amylostereum chailletii]|nr:hypothetical protein OF83DRAFT_1082506 [Amylostereum chailletii]